MAHSMEAVVGGKTASPTSYVFGCALFILVPLLLVGCFFFDLVFLESSPLDLLSVFVAVLGVAAEIPSILSTTSSSLDTWQ